MKNRIITIGDNGVVFVACEARMTIPEIADLFGVYYQTIKRDIRAIEKSGIVTGDYSMSCTVDGLSVNPDYYGLDMIIALAFRVQSAKAEIFRRWIMKKALGHDVTATVVLSLQNALLN